MPVLYTDIDTRKKYVQITFMGILKEKEQVVMSLDKAIDQSGLKHLQSRGYLGNIDQIKVLLNGFSDAPSSVHLKLASRTGWYDDVLITRNGNFGDKKHIDRISFFEDTNTDFPKLENFRGKAETKGQLKAFQKNIKRFLEKSDELIFGYVAAMYAPLLSRMDEGEGFIICLSGEGSTGKTSVELLARSLSAKALTEKDLDPFGDTSGTLLDKIPSFPGQIVLFSEVKNSIEQGSQLVSKIKPILYSVVSGAVRQRKGESKRADALSGIIAILALEVPLSKLFADAKISLQDGERARIIELLIAARKNGGIFQGLSLKKRKQLFKELEQIRSDHYGTIMHDWCNKLAKLDSKNLARRRTKYLKESWYDGKLQDGLEIRIAKHFDNLRGTAQLLDKYDLLPVPLKGVKKALRRIFDQNIGVINPEEKKCNKLNAKIRKKLDNKNLFPTVTLGEKVKSPETCKYGFRRVKNDEELLFVRCAKFVGLFPEEDRQMVLSILHEWIDDGCGKKLKNEYTKSVQQSGLDRPRCLCLYPKKLKLSAKH